MGQRLGQHFLTSSAVIERITEAVCPARELLVIEIGPGEGALTAALIPRADRLVAIELDQALAERLRSRYPAIEVVNANVLDTDLSQWGSAAVAGNLPYYITSPILDRVLSMGTLCRRAVLMMQREVADRLVAQPGTRDYGYLTVRTQSRAQVEFLFPVPRGAFRPPPKVESAIVRLTPLDDAVSREFLEFAGLCFRQKRKTLRNNLAGRYPAIAGLAEARLRAEQLSIAELKSLHTRLLS